MADSLINPSASSYDDRLGDSWELCYCNFYGNDLTNHGIRRQSHLVYACDPHKILQGNRYKKIVEDKQTALKIVPAHYTHSFESDLVPLKEYPSQNSNASYEMVVNMCTEILSIHKDHIISNLFSTVDGKGKLTIVSTLSSNFNIRIDECLLYNRSECCALIERMLVRLNKASNKKSFEHMSALMVTKEAKSILELDPSNENACKRLLGLIS